MTTRILCLGLALASTLLIGGCHSRTAYRTQPAVVNSSPIAQQPCCNAPTQQQVVVPAPGSAPAATAVPPPPGVIR